MEYGINIYNFDTKSCLHAVNVCKVIDKKKEKYNINYVYNKGKIICVKFKGQIEDKALKFILKNLK